MTTVISGACRSAMAPLDYPLPGEADKKAQPQLVRERGSSAQSQQFARPGNCLAHSGPVDVAGYTKRRPPRAFEPRLAHQREIPPVSQMPRAMVAAAQSLSGDRRP